MKKIIIDAFYNLGKKRAIKIAFKKALTIIKD